MEIILASKSPRRKELLSRIFKNFKIVESAVDEAAITRELQAQNAAVTAYARELAMAKAQAAKNQLDSPADSIIIACDTTVSLDDRILGKPRNLAEARNYLLSLAGREHLVHSVAVVLKGEEESLVDSQTWVRFFQMDEAMAAEIERYVNSPSPYDKAGGYGIQEAGAFLIESIRGDYYTVVGLPLAKLKRCLDELDII
ncbi:MAG: Maf family protein [Eubacteriales bacterium]|nr:Maf family protein [Eubacteriales bacterium]